MIKRIVLFLIAVALIFITGYFLNTYLLDINQQTLRFSLLNVYAFNAIACCLIYAAVESIASFLPNKTGFLYLALSTVKLGLFILIFQKVLFSELPLSKAEKISIVVPFLIFLLIEGIGVAKLLNNK